MKLVIKKEAFVIGMVTVTGSWRLSLSHITLGTKLESYLTYYCQGEGALYSNYSRRLVVST